MRRAKKRRAGGKKSSVINAALISALEAAKQFFGE